MKISVVGVLIVVAAALVMPGLALAGCGDASGADNIADMTSEPPAVNSSNPRPSSSLATGSLGTYKPADDTVGPELSITRYEEDRMGLSWTGVWTFGGSARDSGGTSRYTEYPGSSVTVEFTGVSLVVITRTARNLGRVRITVDDRNPITVDCYSPQSGYQQVLWATDPLEPGPHTVTIECAGTTNPASTGKRIYIDAFVVTETPQAIQEEVPEETPKDVTSTTEE